MLQIRSLAVTNKLSHIIPVVPLSRNGPGKLFTIKLPHVPQRRDGDSRLTREIDDMFVLLTSLDEHKYLDSLPRYVASGPDNMPSAGMCEGDIAALMNIMKNMSNEISELRSKLVIVARDVRAIQSRPPEPFPALPEPTAVSYTHLTLPTIYSV